MKAEKWIRFLALACLVCITSSSFATPTRGFFRGPSLQFVVGARNANFDFNVADNTKQSRDIEPVYGFNFGWNLSDAWGFEFIGHYSSASSGDTQQHLMQSALHGRHNFVLRPLTTFSSLRLIPFVTAGPTVQLNILPSAAGASSTRATQWGAGVGASTGLSALMHHDHLYLTLRAGGDYLYRRSVYQEIAGTSTRVYRGGWDFDWHTTANLGVHF